MLQFILLFCCAFAQSWYNNDLFYEVEKNLSYDTEKFFYGTAYPILDSLRQTGGKIEERHYALIDACLLAPLDGALSEGASYLFYDVLGNDYYNQIQLEKAILGLPEEQQNKAWLTIKSYLEFEYYLSVIDSPHKASINNYLNRFQYLNIQGYLTPLSRSGLNNMWDLFYAHHFMTVDKQKLQIPEPVRNKLYNELNAFLTLDEQTIINKAAPVFQLINNGGIISEFFFPVIDACLLAPIGGESKQILSHSLYQILANNYQRQEQLWAAICILPDTQLEMALRRLCSCLFYEYITTHTRENGSINECLSMFTYFSKDLLKLSKDDQLLLVYEWL